MAPRVAHQHEAGVVGRLAPFVEIEGDRVGPLDARQQGLQLGRQGGQGAEGPVHVQPQPLAGGDVGQGAQIVDRADVDRAGRADDQEGVEARGAVRGHRLGQGAGVDAAVREGGDLAQGRRAEAGDVQRLGDAAVGGLGGVGGQAGPRLAHPVRAAFGPKRRGAGGQDRDQVGHGRAGDEQAAGGGGEAEQLGHPARHLALHLDRGVVAPAEVGVEPSRQHLGQHARQVAAAVHPAHEPRMAVAHRVGQHLAHEIVMGRGDPLPRPRQARAESAARLIVHRPPDRAVAQALQVVEHVVEHAMRLRAIARPIHGIEVGPFRRGRRLRSGLQLHRPEGGRFFVNHV